MFMGNRHATEKEIYMCLNDTMGVAMEEGKTVYQYYLVFSYLCELIILL